MREIIFRGKRTDNNEWVCIGGIYLPSPDEDQFLIHIQKEIERNKEFI